MNLQRKGNRSLIIKIIIDRQYIFRGSVSRDTIEITSFAEGFAIRQLKGPSPLGSIITPSPVKQPGARHVIRLSSLHSISPRTEGGREGHAGGSSVKFALGATDNTELVRWIMRGRRGGLDRFPFNSHPRRRATPPEKGLSLSLSLLASRNL